MSAIEKISLQLLDVLPNPILVKDDETRYVWVNAAFEHLFSVKREQLIGKLDIDAFPHRQAAQCNGGDLRVLATGELDEAVEVVVDPLRGERHTITRKIRQVGADGRAFLLGVMHDITDVTTANQRLADAAAQLENQANQLRMMATTDPLTGCLNRRALYRHAETQLGAADTDCSLLMLDLDHFKKVNDRYGHGIGDAALKHFVDVVRMDLREADMFARIGGEEFAVLLAATDLKTAEMVAARVCERVRMTPLNVGGSIVPLTVSIGVTCRVHASDRSTLDDLLGLADQGLYKAKQDGRDRFVTLR